MYRRAALAAPASATAAASSSSATAAAKAAALSSGAAAMAAGTSWRQWRKSVVLHVASALPASERRAIMDQWVVEGEGHPSAIQEAEAQLSTMRSDVNRAKAAETKALAEMERLKQWISFQAKIKPEEATHPVLGQLVADMGYKKIYCASIKQLGDVVIWEQQRILRKERAEAIAREKTRQSFPVKLPGIITLYQKDGQYKLLDGQHRLAALKILADTGIISKDTNFCLVEVFALEKESEARALFLEINSAMPVKLIDMPEGVGARPDIKGIIDGAMESMLSTYPSFFKSSPNPKLPHINIDNLRDDLYQHHIVERHGLKTAEELAQWLQHANDTLSQKQDKDWKRTLKGRNPLVVEKAVAKAIKGGFYLGLDHTWLSWDT